MPALTKADIANRIHEQVGLPKQHSLSCVETTFERILEALEEGNSVKVSGFGVFEVRQKKGRVGRNPKTLTEVKIRPRKVVTFRLSNLFKAELKDR